MGIGGDIFILKPIPYLIHYQMVYILIFISQCLGLNPGFHATSFETKLHPQPLWVFCFVFFLR